MKTDKQIAAEAQQRAGHLIKNKRKHRISTAGLEAACIALVIGLSYAISQMAEITDTDIKPDGAYSAAVFAGGGAGGYVLIGVIAFALGVAVTLFAMRSQRKK